jgi:hypothetical protein
MTSNDIEKVFRKMYDDRCDGKLPYIVRMSPRDTLPSSIEQNIRSLIPSVREQLLDTFIGRDMSDDYYKKKGYYPGSRFNSDSDVICGIEGGSTGDPSYFTKWSYTEMIVAALIDAASRDHWYRFEKVW